MHRPLFQYLYLSIPSLEPSPFVSFCHTHTHTRTRTHTHTHTHAHTHTHTHTHTCTHSVVDCGDPGTPANGVKLGFATTYQSVVNYACRTGFAMRGVSQRTCQASGEWTGSLPLCDLVDCGDPGNIKSGQKTGTNYKFGGKVSYICNNGFQLSGSQTRSCQASGSWSGSTPECVGESWYQQGATVLIDSRSQHVILFELRLHKRGAGFNPNCAAVQGCWDWWSIVYDPPY